MDVPVAMREAKRRVEHELLNLPGVKGVDIGFKEVAGKPTDQLAIRVLVDKKKKVPSAQQVPKKIDGHPTDVIERRFELHQMSNRVKENAISLQADTGTYDPLKGGCSIGPCRAVNGYIYAGTMGAVVRDNATGNALLLSNFHVMCVDSNWHAGDQMAQPSRVDGGSCPASVVGGIARAALTATVDGALADITASRGHVCEIIEVGAIKGAAAASVGMAVRKRGRTTGLTYGTIDTIDLTVNIDYGDGIGQRTLNNQIGVKPDPAHSTKFSDHGDSGAVVVDASNQVVGLNFAGDETGYGISNPIADVLGTLNISMCVSKTPLKEIKDNKYEKLEKVEVKEHKPEKFEIKEHKPEKYEKHEKFEKHEYKELKVEKFEIGEIPPAHIPPIPKLSEVAPGLPGGPPAGAGGLGGMFGHESAGFGALHESSGWGSPQQPHFIPRELRPDLGRGALSNEPDCGER
jgi:hypothetical protein